MLCCPKSDLKWIRGGKRDRSDVKRQMADVEKPIFCSVSISFKFCSSCHESKKENSDFSLFENVRVTVSY